MEVRDSVLEDFKTLAKEQGIDDKGIYIKKNQGAKKCFQSIITLHALQSEISEKLFLDHVLQESVFLENQW